MTDSALTVRPLLPLRDIVLFPGMIVPLFVGRPSSVAAVRAALSDGGTLLTVTQRRAGDDSPEPADLFAVGTLVRVRDHLDLPDGTLKILVESVQRAAIVEVRFVKPHPSAFCRPLGDTAADAPDCPGLARAALAAFEAYVRSNRIIPPEVASRAAMTPAPSALADLVISHLGVPVGVKQGVLEAAAVDERLRLCLAAMGARSRWPASTISPDLE